MQASFPIESESLCKEIQELKKDPSNVLTKFEVSLYNSIKPQMKAMGALVLGGVVLTVGTSFFSLWVSGFFGLSLLGFMSLAVFDSQAGDMVRIFCTYRSYLRSIKNSDNLAEDYVLLYEKKIEPELLERKAKCRKDIARLVSKAKKVRGIKKSDFTNEAQKKELGELVIKLESDIEKQRKVKTGLEEQSKSLSRCVQGLKTQANLHTLLLEDSAKEDQDELENTTEQGLINFEESLRIVNDTYQELSLLNFKEGEDN